MKHLLNTLYITTNGSYLHREGETLQIEVEREVKLRLPVHTLGSVICFGQVMVSPAAMHLCMEKQISISFLTENGKFMGKVVGKEHGNILLRRQQYRKADDEVESVKLAKAMVAGKVANCRAVLMRAARDNPQCTGISMLTQTTRTLGHTLKYLKNEECLDGLRGREGSGANFYFEVFDNLIVAQKEDFKFKCRTRRPPLDNVNALLSFVYTLLAHDVESALETVGLDPYAGFLHRDRPGRPSLALDMMEELRPYLADRLVLSLINRQQVKSEGFTATESGGVIMDDKTRKTVLIAYQERKKEEITHPFLQEKMEIGLLPYVQSMLLARCIRNDLPCYTPFVWR
jgi:CRISPR-associated protein Cas1